MNLVLLVVTLFSIALAATMTAIAWRLARDEQRRSDARVAALAAELARTTGNRATAMDLELRPRESTAAPRATDHTMMTMASPSSRGGTSRVALGIAGGIAVLAAIAALGVPLGGGVGTDGHAATPTAAPAAAAPTVELTALGHDRDGGQLTIHGIVRNPGTRRLEHVTAIVAMFDRAGAPLTGARTEIPLIAPGDAVPFAVSVPDDGVVGRYRVTFQQGDTVVRQIDTRQASR
jgi:hypothetical protein